MYMDYTIFRMFNVYGPGQDMNNLKQGMLSIFLAYALKGEKIIVKGDKNRFRDFIYIDDVVDVWCEALLNDITHNKGCDVIFEHVGSNTWPNTMKSLAIGGRVVTCGATTGPMINIDLRHLFMKQQTIMGSTMSDIKSFKQVMNNINKKIYKPFVDKVFIFNKIREAHAYMENRQQMGKIVLVP